MNLVVNSVIWCDRGWSNNDSISANYKCSILVHWHETPHTELEVSSLLWYLFSSSNISLENCGVCISNVFHIFCWSVSWCSQLNVPWSHSFLILNRLFFFYFFFFSFGFLQLMLPETPRPYGLLYYPRIGRSNFLHQFRAATSPKQRKLEL
jgi:hypothetical protein